MNEEKLTIIQKSVILLMQDGWELGCRERMATPSLPLPTSYYLQKGKLRAGGETKKVYQRTIHSLIRLKLITPFILKQSSLTMEGEQLKISLP